MRTIIGVAVGFVILLLLGVLSYKYLEKSSNKLTLDLDQVEVSIHNEDWRNAQQSLMYFNTQWDTSKHWWSLLLDHREIEQMEISLRRLEKYVETQSIPFSMGEVSELKLLLDHISDTEYPSLRNIL